MFTWHLPSKLGNTEKSRHRKFEMASASGTVTKTAKEVIAELNLKPHPEKGYFVETFRDSATDSNGRAHSTQIYYLLEGESGLSHWHRVIDAVEVWHYYAGAPLQLSLSWDDGKPVKNLVLGTDLSAVSHWPLRCSIRIEALIPRIRANVLRSWLSETNGNMHKAWAIGLLSGVPSHRPLPWRALLWRRKDGSPELPSPFVCVCH